MPSIRENNELLEAISDGIPIVTMIAQAKDWWNWSEGKTNSAILALVRRGVITLRAERIYLKGDYPRRL